MCHRRARVRMRRATSTSTITIDDHAQSGEVGVRPGRHATAIGAEGEIRSTTLGLESGVPHSREWLVIWQSALEVVRQLGAVAERRSCQRHGSI
jgi:hypothetical protein